MTDSHDELDPATEAEVRRLVADVRVTEPMPVEVVARLDAVLGDLAADRARQTDHGADVVPLRRRRRRASRLLAAAAVVVGGVAVGQYVVDGRTGADDGADVSAVAPAERAESDDDLTADMEEARPEADAPGASQDGDSTAGIETKQPALVRIRSNHLVDDLVAARIAAADGAVNFRTPRFPPGRSCADAPWGPGQLLAVLFQQAPAVAAFRPATEQTQVVDLLQCGTAEVLRSATLPAP